MSKKNPYAPLYLIYKISLFLVVILLFIINIGQSLSSDLVLLLKGTFLLLLGFCIASYFWISAINKSKKL